MHIDTESKVIDSTIDAVVFPLKREYSYVMDIATVEHIRDLIAPYIQIIQSEEDGGGLLKFYIVRETIEEYATVNVSDILKPVATDSKIEVMVYVNSVKWLLLSIYKSVRETKLRKGLDIDMLKCKEDIVYAKKLYADTFKGDTREYNIL